MLGLEQFISFNMKSFISFLFSMCLISAHAERLVVNVGDIVDISGHKAIVFSLDDTGEHGKAMYVGAFRGVDSPWCSNGKHARKLPDMTDCEHGEKNTKVVMCYAETNNAWSSFPAFNWCHNLGDNWYIPSLMELEGFVNFWLGNEEIFNWDEESEYEVGSDKPFFKDINQKLLEAGGIPFINGVYTSTVDADGKVFVFYYNRRKNTWSLKRRSYTSLGQDCVGRAFINF